MTEFEELRALRQKRANPVSSWLSAPSGSVQAGHGVTPDISSSGVKYVAKKCPSEGVRIQTTIHVARANGSDSPLGLHGGGIFVRSERGNELGLVNDQVVMRYQFIFIPNCRTTQTTRIGTVLSLKNTFTAGRVDESSGCAVLFRRSRRSEQ